MDRRAASDTAALRASASGEARVDAASISVAEPPPPPPAPPRDDEPPPTKRVLFRDIPAEFALAVRLLVAARFLAVVAVAGLAIAVLDSPFEAPWTVCGAERAALIAAQAANSTRTWCGAKSCGSSRPPECYTPFFIGVAPVFLLPEVAAYLLHALHRSSTKLQSPLDVLVLYPGTHCGGANPESNGGSDANYPSLGRGALEDCLGYLLDLARRGHLISPPLLVTPTFAAFLCTLESGLVAARYGGLAAAATSPLPGQVALNWATGLAWALVAGGIVGPPLFFQCLWLRLRQGNPAQAVRLVAEDNNAPASRGRDSILLA